VIAQAAVMVVLVVAFVAIPYSAGRVLARYTEVVGGFLEEGGPGHLMVHLIGLLALLLVLALSMLAWESAGAILQAIR